jgi:hypothetical protein
MTKFSFTEHPASVGETYFEHMGVASSFGIAMLGAGLACLVHAVLPFAFVKTGSDTITGLYRRMVSHRVGGTAPLPGSDYALGGDAD